eukprot:TRINITY_DN9761_c0_g1_i2.p1 TRINITY_DN9761_c0_g1~~TRINITY_DN9761_c0_g1_i2.p1  ORF type:complete len:468 (+),score=94.42 TRINITY_DN9761_c0_g1_i2:142-1545(+)
MRCRYTSALLFPGVVVRALHLPSTIQEERNEPSLAPSLDTLELDEAASDVDVALLENEGFEQADADTDQDATEVSEDSLQFLDKFGDVDLQPPSCQDELTEMADTAAPGNVGAPSETDGMQLEVDIPAFAELPGTTQLPNVGISSATAVHIEKELVTAVVKALRNTTLPQQTPAVAKAAAVVQRASVQPPVAAVKQALPAQPPQQPAPAHPQQSVPKVSPVPSQPPSQPPQLPRKSPPQQYPAHLLEQEPKPPPAQVPKPPPGPPRKQKPKRAAPTRKPKPIRAPPPGQVPKPAATQVKRELVQKAGAITADQASTTTATTTAAEPTTSSTVLVSTVLSTTTTSSTTSTTTSQETTSTSTYLISTTLSTTTTSSATSTTTSKETTSSSTYLISTTLSTTTTSSATSTTTSKETTMTTTVTTTPRPKKKKKPPWACNTKKCQSIRVGLAAGTVSSAMLVVGVVNSLVF